MAHTATVLGGQIAVAGSDKHNLTYQKAYVKSSLQSYRTLHQKINILWRHKTATKFESPAKTKPVLKFHCQ